MGKSQRGRSDWLNTYGRWLAKRYAVQSWEVDQTDCDWPCFEYGCMCGEAP